MCAQGNRAAAAADAGAGTSGATPGTAPDVQNQPGLDEVDEEADRSDANSLIFSGDGSTLIEL